MTDQDAAVQRKVIADAMVAALERRHEVLDAVVASEDYDAAIEALADLLDTSADAAEAVLRLSFDRLTRVSRRRIAAELDTLTSQLASPAPAEQMPGSARRLRLRPFSPDTDRDIFAERTRDMRSAGDGTDAPPGDLGDEIRDAVGRVAAEEAAWLVAEVGAAKVGMVFGELSSGEVDVRIWIHPEHRKRGYGTAALRTSRSEMAAYFPAAPLVVRTPAAGA
ncbi:GNAT family N-acetyltransferase [Mycolicibacterium rufum]|uniref:GNAT family N-acetyltransferase n=1 Tax=Mycolicibacterium rufum TaxID=318424 RepID=A0A9X2YCS2_9MYCO|nr:GNAT family N-acetyltransferase [Mycolicibacterium rufum]KGI67769.1 acetyltransferase [Mycolicibacterium rufum]MCV7071527.1 GNAT family N-acetyltransferase [Mycolicibacterium rufum]ULP38743.1 GNAT family N-acetyltransferase [Mycolicibacterium rufum]